MEPNSVGRKFGIGVRVASKMMIERAARIGEKPAQVTPPGPKKTSVEKPRKPAPLTQVYAHRSKAVAQGARKLTAALWRPVAHASGIIWLQITGLFFSVFAIVFASNTWKLRQNWSAGPGHARFLAFAAVTLVFAWFAGSSFYRAGRKQRSGHRR